jgi:nitroimidazol reductase NimA-like FMN-containing flavoprotein (pyridoxamine 5'-phosphate oxidase superfamily)
MSNRRTQIQMTPEELDAFLAAETKVQIGTVGKDGAPHLSTLFYAMHDGKVAFWTYRTSQKVVNLRRDPRMTCLIETGQAYDQLRGATLYGTARIIDDLDEVLRVGGKVAARMAGAPSEQFDPDSDPQVRAGLEQAGRKRVAVLMDTTRAVTWDHGKLGG